jgi:2-phosphoglycerate kinase
LENSNPFLFSVTHESWKLFGDKTPENIIRGSLMHARSIFPQLKYLIKKSENEGRDLIIEGVHLIPEFISFLKDVDMDIRYYYLYLDKREEHIRRFDLKNHKRRFFHTKWYDNYDTIKIIDAFNVKEAISRNLSLLENNNLDSSLSIISSGVKNEILSC